MPSKIVDQLQQFTVPIESLVLDQNNAKKHPKDNIQAIKNSLETFGQRRVAVVRRAGMVVEAGNGMVMAAKELGWTEIAAILCDDSDIDAKMFALADNRTAELADWDNDVLKGILSGLDADVVADLGWDKKSMADLMRGDAATDGADDIPEARKEIDSKLGGIYELGPHRLICGDSTDHQVIDSVVGEERPQMVWTDPPYGVSYVGGFGHQYSPEERLRKGGKTVENDALSEPQLLELLTKSIGQAHKVCADGSAIYCAAPAGPPSYVFESVLRDLQWWRQSLIWVKSSFVMGRSNYHYRHEPIYYGVKGGSAAHFTKDRTQDSVFEFDRPTKLEDHPTVKPVGLVIRCIENSSQHDWIVIDPFGGSGTTLIACAETKRRARLVELSPAYCDVIRRRWTRWAILNKVDVGSGGLE